MKACMVAYTFYENDTRVRLYAEALAARGDHVDVISLRGPNQEKMDVFNGVRLHRIQQRVHNEKNLFTYLWKLLLFLFLSLYWLTKLQFKERYDVVHVHNVPDFEVFAAIVPKLMGAKIILDIHDILPEFYAYKFKDGENSLKYKFLLFLEKLSISFSDHVIVANHIWQEKLQSRSVAKGKCSVIMNYPDPGIFSHKDIKKDNGKFVLIYPGSLNKHQGLDIAIRAFSRIREEIPEAEFHIYGDGPERSALEKLIGELELEKRVMLSGTIPIDLVVEEMAKADIGIVPKRNDGFGGEAFSTKTWEFMSLKIPIILARTRIDDYYFNNDVVRFFEPENEKSLAQAIVELRRNDQAREEQILKACEYLKDKSWAVKKQDYFNILDKLIH